MVAAENYKHLTRVAISTVVSSTNVLDRLLGLPKFTYRYGYQTTLDRCVGPVTQELYDIVKIIDTQLSLNPTGGIHFHNSTGDKEGRMGISSYLPVDDYVWKEELCYIHPTYKCAQLSISVQDKKWWNNAFASTGSGGNLIFPLETSYVPLTYDIENHVVTAGNDYLSWGGVGKPPSSRVIRNMGLSAYFLTVRDGLLWALGSQINCASTSEGLRDLLMARLLKFEPKDAVAEIRLAINQLTLIKNDADKADGPIAPPDSYTYVRRQDTVLQPPFDRGQLNQLNQYSGRSEPKRLSLMERARLRQQGQVEQLAESSDNAKPPERLSIMERARLRQQKLKQNQTPESSGSAPQR